MEPCSLVCSESLRVAHKSSCLQRSTLCLLRCLWLPAFGIRDWNGADLWVLLNRLQPMFNYGFALRLDDLRKALANDTLVRWSLGQLGTDLLYQDLRLGWFDEIVVNFFTHSL